MHLLSYLIFKIFIFRFLSKIQVIKHKEQVFKAQYFKDHISLTSLTINTPHHILIQVIKHNAQEFKAQVFVHVQQFCRPPLRTTRTHLTYQTDSKNYETCVIVLEIIFSIKTNINTYNFHKANLFGKFDSFRAF